MSLLFLNHLKSESSKHSLYFLNLLFLTSLLLIFYPIIFSIPEYDLINARQFLLIICHQKLERFIDFNGYLPLLCARDIGIFLSISIMFNISIYKYRYKLFLILPILLLEKGIEHFTQIEISNMIRFIDGGLLGCLIASWLQYFFKQK